MTRKEVLQGDTGDTGHSFKAPEPDTRKQKELEQIEETTEKFSMASFFLKREILKTEKRMKEWKHAGVSENVVQEETVLSDLRAALDCLEQGQCEKPAELFSKDVQTKCHDLEGLLDLCKRSQGATEQNIEKSLRIVKEIEWELECLDEIRKASQLEKK